MEQLQLDRQVVTGEMLALEGTASDGCEFIGFDPAPLTQAAPVRDEDVRDTPINPPRSARHRRECAQTGLHSVRIWLDDGEFRKLTDSAGAAGVALPDYLRSRALKDPKARTRSAKCGPDLFLPAASPSSVRKPPSIPEPVFAQLSPDLGTRIDAYYASGDRVDVNANPYGPATRDPKHPAGFSRLGHAFTELLGMRPLGGRALPHRALPWERA